MSSILFKPMIRCPFQSTAEYRELTLTIGSPMVFQTAPPQPASKARITCSPQLAGGPEASQNGFGQRILPANKVVRSAMLRPHCFRLQERGDADACALTVGNCV